MSGFIAKKLGMTRIVNDNGEFVPVTVLDASANVVDQIKTKEKDGVAAIVVARMTSSAKKVLKKKQFEIEEDKVFEKGQSITLDMASEVSEVRITAVSKGKGFQGVIKRHNFHGGRATHGGKYRRAPGSIGTRKPTRTKNGQKLPGHMGDETVTLRNVPLLDVDTQKSLLVVKGPVPGAINGFVFVTLL